MLLGSGSSGGSISLGIRLYLQDQFTGPVGQVQSAVKGLKGEFNAFQENLRAARNVSLALAGAGTVALMGMSNAVKSGADFHYMMRGVEAVSEGTNEQMAKLNAQAIKLGRETMFFPRDIASGMRFMAMAGQDAETIYGTIEAAVNVAGATMTQLGGKMGAADILTNALKAFGWEAQASGRMADLLTKATTSANVSLVDVGNSIRYVAATSRNLAIPVEDTIANLMSLGNAGIQASMGGTALENMYRYLANSMSSAATRNALEAWSQLGIDPNQLRTASGDLLPMADILEKMRDAMSGMGTVEIQNIMRAIFGVRGQRAGATLLRNLEEVRRFQAMLKDPKTADIAAKKMDLMMDSVQGAIWRVGSAWDGLKASFTQSIGTPLIKVFRVIERGIGAISAFIASPIGKVFSQIAAGFIAVAGPMLALNAGAMALAFSVKTLNVSMKSMVSARKFLAAQIFGSATGLASTQKAGRLYPAVMGTTTTGRGANRVTSSVQTTPASYILRSGESVKKGARGGQYIVGPHTKQPRHIPRGATVLANPARGMGMLAGVGRGLMAFLGPIGITLSIVSMAMPLLISAFSRNSKAVDSNTEELKKQASLSSDMRELYELFKNQRLEDIVTNLAYNLESLVQENRVTREAVVQAIESNNMDDLVSVLMSGNRRMQIGFSYDK